jgi:hypothetical protein
VRVTESEELFCCWSNNKHSCWRRYRRDSVIVVAGLEKDFHAMTRRGFAWDYLSPSVDGQLISALALMETRWP